MNNRLHPDFSLLTLSIILISVLLILLISIDANSGNNDRAASQKEAFNYGTRNLVGASSQDVAEFAKQYARAQGDVLKGTPEALLSRVVTREEITALGLGCLPDFASAEEPPLVLVILRGEFQSSIGRAGGHVGAPSSSHLAYVFDIWSAQPVYRLASGGGGVFRRALNDPSLPTQRANLPSVCPTSPASTGVLNYGAIVPPVNTPTIVPISPTVPVSLTITVPVPTPVLTIVPPQPVPTR